MHLEQRVRVLGQLFGQPVGGVFVDAFQLVEERDLFFFLVGVLDDLLTLSRDVGRRDLALRPLC